MNSIKGSMRKTLFDSGIIGLGAFVVPLFHDSATTMNALSAAAAAAEAVIRGAAGAAASGTILLLSVTMILASALSLSSPVAPPLRRKHFSVHTAQFRTLFASRYRSLAPPTRRFSVRTSFSAVCIRANR